MKVLNFYYYICIMIALTICHPTFQIEANLISAFKPHSETKILNGSLENGLTFTLMPSTQLKGGIWVKMDCAIPLDKENFTVSLLTQHALFYGTKQLHRQELAKVLNSLGLDIEADSHVQFNECEQSLQFCLPDGQQEKVKELLGIIYQMTFFPSLGDEEIELARSHMIANHPAIDGVDALPLRSVTALDLRNFYARWYYPENMHLTLVGCENLAEIAKVVSEAFESPLKVTEEISVKEKKDPNLESFKDNFLSFFNDHVELATDNQTLVIDGKIWMKDPNWINKSSNGKTLGTLLTILGISGMILAFPIIAPVAVIAGSLTTATGIYFLTSDYLKDPYYIETLRQTDLQKGCFFAYQKHRAGITLTPYERRTYFLQEMVKNPQMLPKLPILILADLYQLNDPVMAEIFTVDEFNVLTRLKQDFIQKRNHYKLYKEGLEKELAALISPYALARDAALLHARDVYRQNYYVVSTNNLKAARDASIEEIEQAYRNEQISLEKRDEMIEQAHAYYKTCLSDPELKAGLEIAESNLRRMELEIEATYSYQVEVCKQSIQYYARMEEVKLGKHSLINFYNQELVSLLSNFPLYLASLPDYVDLRSL